MKVAILTRDYPPAIGGIATQSNVTLAIHP